jgi:hypothetical protein
MPIAPTKRLGGYPGSDQGSCRASCETVRNPSRRRRGTSAILTLLTMSVAGIMVVPDPAEAQAQGVEDRGMVASRLALIRTGEGDKQRVVMTPRLKPGACQSSRPGFDPRSQQRRH